MYKCTFQIKLIKLLAGKLRALKLGAAISNINSVLLHLSSVGLTKKQVCQVLWYIRDMGIRNIFALRGGVYLFFKQVGFLLNIRE